MNRPLVLFTTANQRFSRLVHNANISRRDKWNYKFVRRSVFNHKTFVLVSSNWTQFINTCWVDNRQQLFFARSLFWLSSSRCRRTCLRSLITPSITPTRFYTRRWLGKYQDFVVISLDWIIVEGLCRWKLSSGNLYIFLYTIYIYYNIW